MTELFYEHEQRYIHRLYKKQLRNATYKGGEFQVPVKGIGRDSFLTPPDRIGYSVITGRTGAAHIWEI